MAEKSKFTTLCYLTRDDQYLMLHRTVKKNDVNHDKWIGVGGHFEGDESPEECLLREVKEETGCTLTSWNFRGLVTFVVRGDAALTEYMCLYTADGFIGEERGIIMEEQLPSEFAFGKGNCADDAPKERGIIMEEGELVWKRFDEIEQLNLWEGDRIFFRLLEENRPFFSLKLVYSPEGELEYAALDGKPMPGYECENK